MARNRFSNASWSTLALGGAMIAFCQCSNNGAENKPDGLALGPFHLSAVCTLGIIRDPGNRILIDRESLEVELSGSTHMTPEMVKTMASSVDFNNSVVAVAHLGYRTQCGETISISNVREQHEFVEIEVTMTYVTAGCSADDALSSPFAFLEIPKSAKSYRFTEKKRELEHCKTPPDK